MATVAIVGASTDPQKHGNRAVRAYLRQGWTVYPVNPSCDRVEGVTAYPDLASLPGPVDRMSIYLPPHIGRALLPSIKKLAVGELFVNPGAWDDAFMAEAERLGLAAIYACSIIDIGERP